MSNQHVTIYSQQVASQVLIRFSIDLAKRTEPISTVPYPIFLGKLNMKNQNRAILTVKAGGSNLKLWFDRSKLKNGSIEAAII